MLERFAVDLPTLLAVAPVAALFTVLAAALAGWLRVGRGVRAPYTRKLFHFIILSAAMVVQLRWGLPGTIVYGSVVAVAVLLAVARGAGNPFYEALARDTDAPHRTLFILIPLATTALGGMAANAFFPTWAHVGYMVVGWGDAVGEPVGTARGRHRYRVPSLAGVQATRSLEGSAAVFVASVTAAAIALLVSGTSPPAVVAVSLAIGAGSTVVEAASNHGIDNFTIQLAASAIAAVLL
jgi:phytol kinase